ncbi:hypothetical protein [Fibrobacter sp. UWEL]|uniref:hypothetical protein n=1 Tax=Fibrobacter sp. UWEL TaxID=1896209 RepID=UPI0009101CB6|nr:hypothetical protein [Fibrobacter sp. UWEL]SHK79705.1 hypothetical protein SAMN05720468_10719 [Fibrobacter sp. UWEL]
MNDPRNTKNLDSLKFCIYYKGEEENPNNPQSPSYDRAAGFAWISESIACRHADGDVDVFLDYVISHMGKWDPYSFIERFGDYLLANTNIPLEDKIRFVEKNFVPNHPILAKLKE